MSMILPSLPARSRRRGEILGLTITAVALGAVVPCRAQTEARTSAAVKIEAPANTQIAADFVGRSGVALSVVTPNSGASSLSVAVAAAPQRADLAAQNRLLTPAADAFRSLIPIGAAVSIVDARLLFDYADIYGTDNVMLVLLQYN